MSAHYPEELEVVMIGDTPIIPLSVCVRPTFGGFAIFGLDDRNAKIPLDFKPSRRDAERLVEEIRCQKTVCLTAPD